MAKKIRKNMVKKENKGKKHRTSGLLIPACLLIGIGIGLFTGQVASFTLIGLGIGFLAMFIYMQK
jgi:hypothetical protein